MSEDQPKSHKESGYLPDNSSKIRTGYKSRNLLKPNDISESLGKLPPQSVDLEQAILGAIMLEKNAYSIVSDFLRANHFYKADHQEIYASITELDRLGNPIDILTVTSQLRKNGKLEFVGGAYYISQLTERVASASNIEYHARIVVEKAIKRDLITIASNIHKEAYEDTTDVFDLIDRTETEFLNIHQDTQKGQLTHVSKITGSHIKHVMALADKNMEITGVPSGLLSLDKKTNGWQDSDLIIIAARPGMGKTGLLCSMARNSAIMFKKDVVIFSLEMTAQQLVNRLIAIEAQFDSEKLMHGKVKKDEWTIIGNAATSLDQGNIYIDDTPGLSIIELRAKVKRFLLQNNADLIMVDYLQLMRGVNLKGMNREAEISQISRELKALAKEVNKPIIAYSQLSRAVEQRSDKRPQLSDLRESGSIEQDADMVIFIYRPEYYGILDDGHGNNTVGLAQLDIAKSRNGSLGRKNVKFIAQYTLFADLDFKTKEEKVQQPDMFNEGEKPPF